MMSMAALSRRRAIQVTAALAGVGLLPAASRAALKPLVWRGTALGATSSLTLYHPDEEEARRLLESVLVEIDRLERVFSLYRADSAVSRLNRDGRLEAPPLELVELLGQARSVSELTDGAFDVTVQPLWRLYADHFARPDTDPNGPGQADLARALSLVDYRAVQVSGGALAFERPGMAVTLNGIAQGYITDRVATLLRRAGFDRVLIDLGEIRALGRHPDGRPWTAGIAHPEDRHRLLHELALEDRALATSAATGLRFEPSGRHHHLFDPRSGYSVRRYDSVSVLAPSAALADGLSTGFSGMEAQAVERVCNALPDVTAIVLAGDGQLHSLGA